MRKLFSFIMAAFLLTCCVPLALAHELVPFDTEISTIEIKDADIIPIAGKTPDDMRLGTIYADGDDTILEVAEFFSEWYDDTELHSMLSVDSFVEGHCYSHSWAFTVKEGYTVSDSVNVIINGSAENYDSETSTPAKGFIWSKSVLCTAISDIDTVNITDVTLTPTAGGRAGDYLSFNMDTSLPVEINEEFWYCDTDAAELDTDDVFEEGKKYSLYICLEADSGYRFTDTTEVFVNGTKDNVDSVTAIDNIYLDIWTLQKECIADTINIESAELTGVTTHPPAGGKAGDFLTVTPAEGMPFTVGKVYWRNESESHSLQNDEVFVEGNYYCMAIKLEPMPGYRFTKETKVFINGSEEDVDQDEVYLYADNSIIIWTVPYKCKAPDVTIGDVNADGKINTADAVVVLKYAAGMITLDEKQNLAGDTNHDGKVNTADAVLILKYAAGMITGF